MKKQLISLLSKFLGGIYSSSMIGDTKKIYHIGDDWERDVHIHLSNKGATLIANIDGKEVRITLEVD